MKLKSFHQVDTSAGIRNGDLQNASYTEFRMFRAQADIFHDIYRLG
jgi:hypothetical protein